MKRVTSPQPRKMPQRPSKRGKLSKVQSGLVLRPIVHDFEVVVDEGVVYEISDDIFQRVERYINSEYDDYKN